MARKRISLQRITNDATRRATFKKRRKGLIKKASELATLCDVDACLVVYGEGDTQPEVWPSLPQATAVLDHFKSLPEMEQYKKMMNQEDFLRQRVIKLNDQVNRAKRETHEHEMNLLVHNTISGSLPGGLSSLTVEQLTSLDWALKMKMKAAADRLAQLNEQAPPLLAPSAPLPLPALPALPAPPVVLPLPLLPSQLAPVVPSYTASVANTGSVMALPPPLLGGLMQEQQAWLLDVARNGGDLGALVYSGYMGGASTSASASANPNSIVCGDGDIAMAPAAPQLPGTREEPADYGWPWPNDQSGPSVPPM